MGLHSFYWRHVIRPHLGTALMVAFLVMATAAFEMVTVGLGLPVLEAAMEGEGSQNRVVVLTRSFLNAFHFPVSTGSVLLSLLVLVCAAGLMRGAFTLWNQYATAGFAKRLPCEVRSRLLSKILKAPYSYFSAQARGTILYNLSQPPTSVFQVITYFSKLAQSAMTALSLFGLMLYLSWWAALAVALLGLLWMQGWHLFADHKAQKAGNVIYDLEAQVSKLEVDGVDGVKVVKAQGLLPSIVKRQAGLLQAEIKPHLKIALLTNSASFLNELIAAVIVLSLGSLSLMGKAGGIPFASLIIFFVALRKISPALGGVSSAYGMLAKERKNIEVIAEILHELPEEKWGFASVGTIGSVELKNVSFAYEGKGPVLENIDLVLKKGELTALVGPTGAGKTTLANLLLGFYSPSVGSIVADGRPLHSFDLENWRKRIGFVSQDIFLFNDTIRNNIALWDDVSEEEMTSAATKAQLDDFIRALPHGYDTVVGDRGIKLSGGQCQRVAIARAILRRPELLIFDEATSALDNLTEKSVYTAIEALRKEAIVLVIAHRLSTIQSADQIAVLEKGRIVELGRHEHLMKQNNAYSRLYGVILSEAKNLLDYQVDPSLRSG